MCDSDSQFVAGHVVDAKGASAEHAIGQGVRDFRQGGALGKSESEGGPGVVLDRFMQGRGGGTG